MKRFREKIGGEYGGPSKSLAREIFFFAIEKEAPEVIEALREILPQYPGFDWGEFIDYDFASDDEYYRTKDIRKRAEDKACIRWKILCSNPEHKVFRAALEGWGRRFNIAKPWIFEPALWVLEMWNEELAKGLSSKNIKTSWGFIRKASSEEMSRGDIYLAGVFDDVDLIESVLQMNYENFESTISHEEHAWNPLSIPKKQYRAFAIKNFEEAIDEHIKMVEGRLPSFTVSTPEYRTEKHFNWLVLYHIRGYTATEIADLYEERVGDILTEDNIMKAVRKTAQWVGLEIKPGKT